MCYEQGNALSSGLLDTHNEEKYVYIPVHIDLLVHYCVFLTTFDPLKSMKSMLDLIDSPH